MFLKISRSRSQDKHSPWDSNPNISHCLAILIFFSLHHSLLVHCFYPTGITTITTFSLSYCLFSSLHIYYQFQNYIVIHSVNSNFITIFLFKLTTTSQSYINFSSPLQVSTYWLFLNSKHTKITTFNIMENSAYTNLLCFFTKGKGGIIELTWSGLKATGI